MRNIDDIVGLLDIVHRDTSLNYKLRGLMIVFILNDDGITLSIFDLVNIWGISDTQVRRYLDMLIRGRYIKRLGRSSGEGLDRGAASTFKYGIGERYVKDAEGYSIRQPSSDS